MARDGNPFGSGDRRRLGDILLSEGVIDETSLALSLAAQGESGARIGEILIARGGANRAAVAAAAARQAGFGFADLGAAPLDARLINENDIEHLIREQMAPWRLESGAIVWAAVAPERAAEALGAKGKEIYAVESRELFGELIGICGPHLAKRSAIRRPGESSLRTGFARWQRTGFGIAFLIALLATAFRPDLALAGFFCLAALVMAVNGGLWGAALFSGSLHKSAISVKTPLPVISLLVPLYHEPETAPLLLKSLMGLDYPPELLDIKLILESDDSETLAAFKALDPPPNVEILIAPDGEPRTKPRALNFALDFARGELIGIYDAEDQPAADQLRRIAAQFAKAPPDVACIQARLGYYNARENWLTRCFEIEYASWFDAMLPGLFRLGMPIPLGGTSLFIRREALEEVGGWDSHNVTEDADLGMMLARKGLKTELSDSITLEEASSRPGAWIRQRSRWLKGYLSTWATHMRKPRSLLRDLGLWRFAGFNAVLLSAALGYLLLPWLWFASIAGLFVDLRAAGAGQALDAARIATWAVLPLMLAAAGCGLWRRKRRWLGFMISTLPFYWVLGSCAAYLAAWELIRAPSRWRKTRHGVGRIAAELRRSAMQEHHGK